MKKLWIFCLLLLPLLMSAQEKGWITGTVTDIETGEALIGATIIIFEGPKQVTGATTDFEGKYNFELPSGTYHLEFSYIGYTPQRVEDVVVEAGKETRLDMKMENSVVVAEEVTIIAYRKPIIQMDMSTQGSVVRPNDRYSGNSVPSGKKKKRRKGQADGKVKELPTRNIHGLVNTTTGSPKKKKAEASVKGSRPNSTYYYIDGIRVFGNQIAEEELGPESDYVDVRDRRKEEPRQVWNTEDYNAIVENADKEVSVHPLSTFSIDVDHASYTLFRQHLQHNTYPPLSAIRAEEWINYFEYDYPQPEGDLPFAVYTELSDCPWNAERKLLHIGLQGRKPDLTALPPSNLIFLLDVSGSMQPPNKLPLLQSALRLLVEQLRPEDKVTIVVYAGAAGEVLPPTPGSEKERILKCLDRLSSGGSTAGGAGIELAYKRAKEEFIEGGNNRVILATDGDFNVGLSSDAAMQDLIEEKRKAGIFLTALGFGMGNIKDNRLELLANKGNGHYAYIDNMLEAEKVFVHELRANLFTIAKDVKLQLEFNPARVQSYRLVGYENRMLAAEDFNDDSKDAGEIGAGHSVTALYELVLQTEINEELVAGTSVDPLRYQVRTLKPVATQAEEIAVLKIRYKEPDGEKSRLLSEPISSAEIPVEQTSNDYRFSTAVAALALNLRGSAFNTELKDLKAIRKLAEGAQGEDKREYRKDFLRLLRQSEYLVKKEKF